MKRYFLLIIACGIYMGSKAQTVDDTIPNIPEPKPVIRVGYGPVEIEPQYPGGMDEFYKYLDNNIVYPKKALREKVQGKVFITFIVGKDGCLTNIRAVRSPSVELSNECVRVLDDCRFIPGSQLGKPVRVQYTVPIMFDSEHPSEHHQIPKAW